MLILDIYNICIYTGLNGTFWVDRLVNTIIDCQDIRAAEMEVEVVQTRKQIEVEEKEVIRRER